MSATTATTPGSGSNTGGGAGTGSGNGSGSGSGTHPTGGSGTGPKLAQAVALLGVGVTLIAAALSGPAPVEEPAPQRWRPATAEEERAYEVARLWAELELAARHNPLSPAVWSEPAPASSASVGAGRQLPPLITGGAALVVGPAVHDTTPVVGGERAVFRGTAP